MNKLIINESEKSHILNLYGDINEGMTNDVVITDWLSPDEKYVVFLDELYDIQNKVKLGNIWEDYNTLKTFLHHTFSTSKFSKQIKENAEKVLNNKLLLEGKQNLNELKSAVKILVNEGLLNNFKNWVVKTGKSTVDGFVEFAKTAYKGSAELIDKISNGEWKEVFNLLKRGVLYLFRKVRSAMYHPVGLIIDAILVATGIGKAVQWIPWAIIVSLDVYEMVSGDYEENIPTWQRLLFFGIDILGLVTTGVAAKAAKTAVAGKNLTTIAKSPIGKRLLTKIAESAEKAPEMLRKASKYLTTKFSKGSTFISNILGKVGGLIESLVKSIKKVIGLPNKVLTKVIPGETKLAKGTRAGVGTTALVSGIGTYGEYDLEKQENKISDILTNNSVDYKMDDL